MLELVVSSVQHPPCLLGLVFLCDEGFEEVVFGGRGVDAGAFALEAGGRGAGCCALGAWASAVGEGGGSLEGCGVVVDWGEESRAWGGRT